MKPLTAALVAAAFVATACGATPEPAERAAAGAGVTVRDVHSYADPSAFLATHLVLDLTADFDARTLAGTAEVRFDRRDPQAAEVVLDTRDLTIDRVETAAGDGAWAATTFTLDPADAALGSALRVAMPAGADRVRVTYTSSPGAKGLQWLTPAQTAGKRHPFLFSQAQSIQARSFIPLQDSPGVRVTYDATLRIPPGLTAVMAAEREPVEAGSGVFRFRMPQPIPSYLIALAVGDLAFQSMGPRTGVWAEPPVVESAAREFADTERMIDVTESLYGPYRWERYDLLVLPPSFPFGGMENPRLTFATPTIIAGDKSLVSLVAHELAHSWSGNLATNATWQDFWLNEGFTTYLERRIVEAIYGKRRADMEAVIGLRDLESDRGTLTEPGDRTLLPSLEGRDPDEAFSTVPYEQGALFLSFLEATYGRETFDAFLRRWFDEHAFQSVTTDQFVAFLGANLMQAHPGLVTDAQVDEWLHAASVPAFAVLPASDAFAGVERARDRWLEGGEPGALAATAGAWSTQEWIHFVDTLPRDLDAAKLSVLDDRFHLTGSTNAEIAHVWFRLSIAARYRAAYPAMEAYMVRIGRRKLIVPLYRDLAATPEGLAFARGVYAKARDGYHPMAQDVIDPLIKSGG
jgi:aminopeptidase N